MKRGQTGVMDLIVAVVIAIITITAIAISWDRFIIKLNEKNEFNDLQLKLFQISDLLVTSEGNTDQWDINSSKLSSFGLAIDDRIISRNKVGNFTKNTNDFNLTNITNLLNIETYYFFMNITFLNGSQIAYIGPNPSLNKSVVSFGRYVKYGNEPAEIITKLWKK